VFARFPRGTSLPPRSTTWRRSIACPRTLPTVRNRWCVKHAVISSNPTRRSPVGQLVLRRISPSALATKSERRRPFSVLTIISLASNSRWSDDSVQQQARLPDQDGPWLLTPHFPLELSLPVLFLLPLELSPLVLFSPTRAFTSSPFSTY